MTPKITTKQRNVLLSLKNAEGHPTTRNLADHLETARFRSATYSYGEVRSQLVALERKGCVERVRGGRALKWRTTDLGKQALD